MHTERDLLPWIFGGLLLTLVAVGMALSLTNKPSVALMPSRPAAVLATTSNDVPIVPAPLATAAPSSSPPLAVAATAAVAPVNHIWECDVGGRRIFADSPCGEHAAIREIGAVNGMVPVNVAAVYAPMPMYPGGSGYQEPADTAPESPDTQGSNIYFFYGVARHDHLGRHHPHERGPHGLHR